MVNTAQGSMASPQTATYRSPRIPFYGPPDNRSADLTKDQRYINFFPESIKTKMTEETIMHLVKRPGLSTYRTLSTGEGRGIWYYQGHDYCVIGNTLYRDGSSIQTLDTSTGAVGWEEATGTTDYLVLADGISIYLITAAGAVTKVTNGEVSSVTVLTGGTGYTGASTVTFSAPVSGVTATGTLVLSGSTITAVTITNRGSGYTSAPTITIGAPGSGATFTVNLNALPNPHIPTPVFMDGYIFLPKSNTADIYNSNLEDPQNWISTNFITKEQFPDNITGLSRQNNQVLAIGSMSAEFFYDAANVNTSPLQRQESTTLQFGSPAYATIFQNEKFCTFIGSSNTGGHVVWTIDGFNPKKISTEAIERLLDNEGTSISSVKAFGLRTKGHFFYVINLSSTTVVYDYEENVWHEWSSNNGSGSHLAFQCSFATDPLNGKSILLHNTNGKIYTLDPGVYQDDGVSILGQVITQKYDFETMNRKFMYNMEIVSDTTAPNSSSLSLRWTDDDYITWNAYKTISVSNRAYFKRMGFFRRRAFDILYTDNFDLRLVGMEFDINQGMH